MLKGLTSFPENTKLLTGYGEYLLLSNKKEQAFNYLSKAHTVEPKNVKVWELLIGLDEYKNDPAMIEVKKLVREKIRDNPIAPIAEKLHARLKESKK